MSILTPNPIPRKELFTEYDLGRKAFQDDQGHLLALCTPAFLEGYREAFDEFYPHDDSGNLIDEYWDQHLSELALSWANGTYHAKTDFDRCASCGRMWLKSVDPVHFDRCPKLEFFRDLENRTADDDDGFELSHKAHTAGVTKADWRDYRARKFSSFAF